MQQRVQTPLSKSGGQSSHHGPAQQESIPSGNRAQDAFLRSRLGRPVALQLLLPDNIVLKGTLIAYDDYTILVRMTLKDGEHDVLCFKHAIAFVR
jgi:sRNA-binding regulator protein Hfq